MTATRSGSGRPGPNPGRAVDPRLQARRREVARQEGARRLWLIGGLALVTSLVIAVIAALNSSWLAVERVEVVGAVNTDPAQIVATSGVVPGQALVEVDIEPAVAAINGLPWVADTRIRRSLNGTVTVEVTERTAAVAVAAGAGNVLVDRSGRQLDVVPGLPEGLMVVRGLEVSAVPGEPVSALGLEVLSLVEGLSPALASVVSGVVTEEGEVHVELASGGRANFGDVRDLEAKMVALETILARVDLSCLAQIDVRAPLAPTVRRYPATPHQDDPGTGAESAPRAAGEEPLAAPGGC